MDEQLRLFQQLTEAHGAPGFEDEVREIMMAHLSRYTNELVKDNLGGVFGVRRGPEGAPTVMVAGHMDEVAFMVKRITKEGLIKFQTLGGWWSQVLLAQRVQILTEKGPVTGVIGSTPPHILSESKRNKPMPLEEMFIDIGALDKEDAEKSGVKPGQPILPICPFEVLDNGKRMMAKAWDNRYGCALAIQLLEALAGEQNMPNTLYSGATVQEEVGLRGAAVAAEMINPDIFFALDASPAGGDIPGDPDGFGKIGQGVLMRIYDRSMITHPELRDFLIDTAEAANIPYQFFISQGGTDAGRVHLSGNGVPSAVIGIPSRYIHSHASIVDKDDYEAAKQLLITLVKKLDRGTVDRILRRG